MGEEKANTRCREVAGAAGSGMTACDEEQIGAEIYVVRSKRRRKRNDERSCHLCSARQELLLRMAVVLANVDYFEELSALLVAGVTSGEEAVVLTEADLTNLRKLVEIKLLVLKDQLESGFRSATKEA
jgi:hypothetical protein